VVLSREAGIRLWGRKKLDFGVMVAGGDKGAGGQALGHRV